MSEQTIFEMAVGTINIINKTDRGVKGVVTTEATLSNVKFSLQGDVVTNCINRILAEHVGSNVSVLTPDALRDVLLGVINSRKFKNGIKKGILSAEKEMAKAREEEFEEMLDNSSAEVITRTLSEDEMRDDEPPISNEELSRIRDGNLKWMDVMKLARMISQICGSPKFGIDGSCITIDGNKLFLVLNKEDNRFYYLGFAGADTMTIIADGDNSRVYINHIGYDDDHERHVSIHRNHPIKLNNSIRTVGDTPYSYVEAGSVSLNCATIGSIMADVLASPVDEIRKRVKIFKTDNSAISV